MAKLHAGILGAMTGKVAGVVGARWKDKNYVRGYSIPANPKTEAQQAQRTKMAKAVAFGKLFVGQVFNVYTDPLTRGMSGFNKFIKDNIDYFEGDVGYSNLMLVMGKLYFPSIISAVYTTGTGNCVITWDTGLGSNGAADDKIYGALYNMSEEVAYFPAAEVNRSVGTLTINGGALKVYDEFVAYAWPAKYVAGRVDMVGNAVAEIATAP